MSDDVWKEIDVLREQGGWDNVEIDAWGGTWYLFLCIGEFEGACYHLARDMRPR